MDAPVLTENVRRTLEQIEQRLTRGIELRKRIDEEKLIYFRRLLFKHSKGELEDKRNVHTDYSRAAIAARRNDSLVETLSAMVTEKFQLVIQNITSLMYYKVKL